LAGLVVALLVLANTLITPERVKQTILPLAEELLQRKMDLGDINVSLLSGVEIHGLTIYEKDSDEIFISTDLVRLKYQLLPLLAMKVVIDEVRLEKPIIRVVRLSDGKFNFSDLLGETDADDRNQNLASNETSRDAATKDVASTPINLLITQVLVQDGQLTFLDRVLNDQAPYRYEISKLQIAAKGVSLTGKVPLTVKCEINGSPLTLDGQISLQPLGGDFIVELQNLDVVAFKPYFQEALPGELGGMKLNFKSTLAGTLDEVFLKGKVSLSELDLRLDVIPDVPVNNAQLKVNYGLVFNPKQEKLLIHDLDLDYNGIKVNAKGEVSELKNTPVFDLTIVVPQLQIRQALNAIPQGLVADVSALDPAGSLSVEASVSSRTENPADGLAGLLKFATIDLENVQATAGGQRPAFTGRLFIIDDQLSSEGLQVRLGDNKADINLKVDGIYSRPIVVRADISSDNFLLEPLLQGSTGSVLATDQGNSESTGKRSANEVGPFDIPLYATGAITVAKTTWKGLAVKNFLAQYELKDNVLNLIRIDGQVAGGTFNNSARVDLGKKGLVYSAKLDLKAVQTDPLLTAFVPKAAGSLFGAMDLTLALDGRGSQWQFLSRNLSGLGKMQIAGGRMISPALVEGLSSFLQLPELNDIQFDDFSGQFKIVDGKVMLDSQMLSSKLKLFPKGTIGLNGSLNLGLDTRLSPELSSKLDPKGGITSYLVDQDGWTRMPLLLKGSFASPSFGLDPKGVQEQAAKAITNELGRQLDKLLKSQDSSQETDQQQTGEETLSEKDSTRKLLQDSLQKLFGN
ncbi:MAG: AsmA family protein, partial [Candidatus Marinimicrobia bacterium]|nr:AsmA family protein [Candidatus Neomarinimicrobiota bacterium]